MPSDSTSTSLDRVRRALETPRGKLVLRARLPTVVFRAEVRQTYVPDFKESLHKLFALNAYQRQSVDWASRGPGINLDAVARSIGRVFREAEVGRARREVEAELEALQRANDAAAREANRTKAANRLAPSNRRGSSS